MLKENNQETVDTSTGREHDKIHSSNVNNSTVTMISDTVTVSGKKDNATVFIGSQVSQRDKDTQIFAALETGNPKPSAREEVIPKVKNDDNYLSFNNTNSSTLNLSDCKNERLIDLPPTITKNQNIISKEFFYAWAQMGSQLGIEDAVTSSTKNDENHDETKKSIVVSELHEESQKHEIHQFAAWANNDASSTDQNVTNNNDLGFMKDHQKAKNNDINQFAAWASNSISTNNNNDDDYIDPCADKEKKKVKKNDERNQFSAWAHDGTASNECDDDYIDVGMRKEQQALKQNNEVAQFTAWAMNGNAIVESNNKSFDDGALKEDQKAKQNNDINQFSAWANNDNTSSTLSLEKSDVALHMQKKEKQKNEINQFAAWANHGGSFIATSVNKDINNVEKHRETEQNNDFNQSTPWDDNSVTTNKDVLGENLRIKQDSKINQFSAWAYKGDVASNSASSNDAASNKVQLSASEQKAIQDEADTLRRKKEMKSFAAMANGEIKTTFEYTPTSSSQAKNMSTFELSSSHGKNKSPKPDKNRNLAAAVASLTETESTSFSSSNNTAALTASNKSSMTITSGSTPSSSNISNTTLPFLLASSASPVETPLCKQMYDECILLPRPLFFGPHLPPRIYQETQKQKALIPSFYNPPTNATITHNSPTPTGSISRLSTHFPMMHVTSPTSSITIVEEEEEGEDAEETKKFSRVISPTLSNTSTRKINDKMSNNQLPLSPNDNFIKSMSPLSTDCTSQNGFWGSDNYNNINYFHNKNVSRQQHQYLGRTSSNNNTSWEYRNLESVISVFGNGIGFGSNCNEYFNRNEQTRVSSWRRKVPSSYCMHFCPVLGDRARLEREDRIRKNKITLSTTNVVEETKSNGDNIKLVNKNLATSQIPLADDEIESSTLAKSSNERKNSSMTIRNSIDTSQINNKLTKPVSKKSNDDALQSSGLKENPQTTQMALTGIKKPNNDANEQMSTNLFLQYARGGDNSDWDNRGQQSGTLSAVPEGKVAEQQQFLETDTFKPLIQNAKVDSGSFEGSELKKKVGMNDNISAALQYIGDETVEAGSLTAAEAGSFANRAQGAEFFRFATAEGRTYTNIELTGGRVPLYGCDDTPLPIESDLGTFETSEDQKKFNERRDSEYIIENIAVPSVFGSVICPSPCTGPDDSQSWNNRSARGTDTSYPTQELPIQKYENHNKLPSTPHPTVHRRSHSFDSSGSVRTSASSELNFGNKGGPPLPSPPPIGSETSVSGRSKSSGIATRSVGSVSTQSIHQHFPQRPNLPQENTRVGWWNAPADFGLNYSNNDLMDSGEFTLAKGENKNTSNSSSSSSDVYINKLVQLPHASSVRTALDIKTNLSPTPEKIREMNKSMANVHPATANARFLPYLSDRPPSTRYVQIDTKAVGFPPVGEIEPLFCSLAIWNVEATSGTGSGKDINSIKFNNKKSSASVAPVPHISRCGRVTESLHFDIVNHPDVKEMCRHSLWPGIFNEDKDIIIYSTKESDSNTHHPKFDDFPAEERLVGTRSGVFPLASNFKLSNLWAVLIVHKVLSDESEIDIYFKSNSRNRSENSKSSQQKAKNSPSDIAKHRGKAAKTSQRMGNFLVPFAFGVVPLIQVLKTDSPSEPFSRAVQIPLFKLNPGNGDKSIIDHIMIMLFPKANHASGRKPGDLTKDGSATLVMRNFGYLGLHSAIHSKSSLARDRLVDFTGELQIRRQDNENTLETEDNDEGRVNVISPWHLGFVGEAVSFGGRNVVNSFFKDDVKALIAEDNIKLPLYTQELAQIPLSLSPPSNRSGATKIGPRGIKGGISMTGNDAEPYFYTTFCNELICQPRLLHNCWKRNIVVKVEMRQIRWSNEHNSFVAVVPSCGPSIHNKRRGKFLVQEAFTCCAYHTVDPKFLDEFKIKLPLVLSNGKSDEEGRLVLLFSVYNISVKGKSKWTRNLKGAKSKALISNAMSSLSRHNSTHEGTDDSSTELNEVDKKSSSQGSMELLGCGLLPLAQSESVPCLIANSLHDVKIKYMTKSIDVTEEKQSSFEKFYTRNDSDASLKSFLSEGTHVPHLMSETENNNEKYSLPPGTLIIKPIKSISSSKNSTPTTTTPGDQSKQSFFGTDSAKAGFAEDIFSSKSPDIEVSQIDSNVCPNERTSVSNIRDTSKGTLVDEEENETMILQVRTIALSSIHPQNQNLAMFFCHHPNPPRCLSIDEVCSPSGPWRLSRIDLVTQMNPDRMAQLNFDEESMSEESNKLLRYTIEISKESLCPRSELCPHLLRIKFQLFRAMVSGTGDPSLLWANPASLIPLRLHSFSTLLTILTSVTTFMSKQGVTQLDGKNKWDLVSMGKIVSLLFDEDALFSGSNGVPLEEYTDIFEEFESPPEDGNARVMDSKTANGSSIKMSKNRGHVRKPSFEQMNVDFPLGKFDSENFGKQETYENNAFSGSLSPTGNQDIINSQFFRSKDDFVIPTKVEKPVLSVRSFSESSTEMKIDSKADFQSNLKAGNNNAKDGSTSSHQNSNRKINSTNYHNGPAASRRKYMTAPSFSMLCTIQEDTDKMDEVNKSEKKYDFSSGINEKSNTLSFLSKIEDRDLNQDNENIDVLDKELELRNSNGSKPKQMRIPKVLPSNIPKPAQPDLSSADPERQDMTSKKPIKGTASSNEIEKAGVSYLDMIGKGLGISVAPKDMGGEEKRVGYAHHRKTKSRCSIDWSLPFIDKVVEDHQQLEQIQRQEGSDRIIAIGDSKNDDGPNTAGKDIGGISERSNSIEPIKKEFSPEETMDSKSGLDDADTFPLKNEPSERKSPPIWETEYQSKRVIKLPAFIDRIVTLGRKKKQGRWFPYTYEVIIFQWVALLLEQTKGDLSNIPKGTVSDKTPKKKPTGDNVNACHSPVRSKYLSEAAAKARGVTIGCAPILFDIIKKSLAWRIDAIFRRSKKNSSKVFNTAMPEFDVPPLVTLDETLLLKLEELVTMVTDACIDSRNFDSWQHRQTSADVNDSIVQFLRDLFSCLEPTAVHKLVLVYFSRFVMKEGKHWHDRDSKIGLRCSWEICKLRLNAITIFVRYSDFFKLNSPIMESWGSWPLTCPPHLAGPFFSKALDELEALSMTGFSTTEGPVRRGSITIPPWKPHWLVELVTDVCLAAAGHVEQNIQHRASSLIYELFWTASQDGKVNNTLSVLSSMFVPFIVKVLGHIQYLAGLSPRSQLRKDLLSSVIFVLQSAPVGLMRALWRKLCKRAEGISLESNSQFGGIGEYHVTSQGDDETGDNMKKAPGSEKYEENQLPSIFDIFSLLNLSLKTFEYEGSDFNMEEEVGDEPNENVSSWKKEYLSVLEEEGYANISNKPNRYYSTDKTIAKNSSQRYTTSNSRKWISHDGTIVIIKTTRYIVREAAGMLNPLNVAVSPEPPMNTSHQNPEESFTVRQKSHTKTEKSVTPPQDNLKFSTKDKIFFARGISSVYLHCLSLRQSDIVYKKTLIASVEIVKVFGVKVFLAAIGETLQHWMRVVLMHCGARRAEVRVQALEFLALILRLTWNSFGSFYRVRVPLLAVQTEVMERIVATAAARYYREQRRLECLVQYLSNEMAEASLAPLWRTLDRLHYQSASQNIAFKSALERLAKKMKTLFSAYIAAHALAIVNRTKLLPNINNSFIKDGNGSIQSLSNGSYLQTLTRQAQRVSSGFSKQFLGNQGNAPQRDAVTHDEAVEDAFLAAADVFSPSELPSHRVAWLHKLADFHNSRGKFGEEATCRFHIHYTLRQAASLHETLWNSVPFFPWTNDSSDGVHLEGDGPVGESGDYQDDNYEKDAKGIEFDNEMQPGRNIDKNDSFRRIFYRVANSVRMRTGDWDVGGNKNLFYGVTFASEYNVVSPWMSLREIEEDMVDEAESSGELFLKAGIVESSRYSWNLVTKFYSEMFNYGRLASVYGKLAKVVASEIPVVDTSNQLELSSPLGRFYRVYFHGGAPDELVGAEFVYRADVLVNLEKFGKKLSDILKSILPNKTPIDLLLDDGRPEDPKKAKNQRRPLGGPTREPIKIKITPLRPLFVGEKCLRGTPEWFHIQTLCGGPVEIERKYGTFKRSEWNKNERYNKAQTGTCQSRYSFQYSTAFLGRLNQNAVGGGSGAGGALLGVDKFSFNQPFYKKGPARSSRDWLKGPKSEKSIKVTNLQVAKDFPACVARQKVANRSVLYQCPLEAGIDTVCSWCSVLFRTAVATSGLALIGTQADEGIGREAVRVVSESIHCSRVKEIGLKFLSSNGFEDTSVDEGMSVYEKLSDDEVKKNEIKLARSIVTFMELLHLLICRNRDLLLSVLKSRKRSKEGGSSSACSVSLHGITASSNKHYHRSISDSYSPDYADRNYSSTYSKSAPLLPHHDMTPYADADGYRPYDDAATVTSYSDRTVDACSLQRELQRAFTSMARSLYPVLVEIIKNETPKWIKNCWQDSKYYSSGVYRRTRTAMGEELFLHAGNTQVVQQTTDYDRTPRPEPNTAPLSNILTRDNSPHNSNAGSITSRNSGTSKKSRNSLSSAAESRSGWRLKEGAS